MPFCKPVGQAVDGRCLVFPAARSDDVDKPSIEEHVNRVGDGSAGTNTPFSLHFIVGIDQLPIVGRNPLGFLLALPGRLPDPTIKSQIDFDG